jgi:hypothetical protein
MGGFYFISFSTHLIVFDVRLMSRAIKQMVMLFSSLRNTTLSFFKNLAKFFTAFLVLGIHLKPQSV